MTTTDAAMRLIARQPDKELLAEALGLVGYWGKDSASATISGHRALPKWREAGEDHRPRGGIDGARADVWRHTRRGGTTKATLRPAAVGSSDTYFCRRCGIERAAGGRGTTVCRDCADVLRREGAA